MARETLEQIQCAVSHLRARTSSSFITQAQMRIEEVDHTPLGEDVIKSASELCRLNWALVLPYFETLKKLPQTKDLIEPWTRMTLELARQDIDVAVTFVEQTPVALEHRGAASLLFWGELALEALTKAESRRNIWKAVNAYLPVAGALQCGYPLTRWKFFLEQALRIAEVSPEAAEAFIRMGNRMCLLLTDEETIRWVEQGLDTCRSEDERVSFFNGTSLKALESRDGLATGVALKDRSQTLALICEAALGRPVKIQSNTALIGHKGFTGGAATDGRTIFLPDTVPNFGLMKLMALHQAMLLHRSHFLENSGRIVFDPAPIHLDADRRLLERLPGLLTVMGQTAEFDLPAAYPQKLDKKMSAPLPWWGDILPDLIGQTSETIAQIKEKTSQAYGEDVPPELVEALLATMMAQGERDGDALWEMFREMLDNMVFDSPDAEELEAHVKTFFYKEWDRTLSDYKLDWCLVRQRPAADDPNDFVAKLREELHGIIALLRRQFMKLKPERFRKYKAQPTGDALDIDALVQAMVDKRTGSHLSENVYVRRDKRIRDVAVLFLLDLSGSTEEEVGGRRVVDIQKEAMALMAEALDSLGDPYAIYGFSSEGRFRVDLFGVKDFGEPYDQTVQYRLGNLEPLGLTRMGAVIRHAVYKLEKVPAAIKLLVILTDGRPYDLEYGTLDYAIADTGKAISEARRARIHPFIITSDKKGAEYLRKISSETQSIVLPKVESLPTMLPALYKRLTL
jgi:von Willebrand factor type A domain